MADERLLVPIDDPYLRALGLATICFARAEWAAVWCVEKLRPGYVQTVARKQAGTIAKDLEKVATLPVDSAVVASLSSAATAFTYLVTRRNGLVHANPGTAPFGEQRLFRDGTQWTIKDVDDLADMFASVGQTLNYHYHSLL